VNHRSDGGMAGVLGNVRSSVRNLPGNAFGSGHIGERKPHRSSEGANDDLAHSYLALLPLRMTNRVSEIWFRGSRFFGDVED
jgi:hypothetical protein